MSDEDRDEARGRIEEKLNHVFRDQHEIRERVVRLETKGESTDAALARIEAAQRRHEEKQREDVSRAKDAEAELRQEMRAGFSSIQSQVNNLRDGLREDIAPVREEQRKLMWWLVGAIASAFALVFKESLAEIGGGLRSAIQDFMKGET